MLRRLLLLCLLPLPALADGGFAAFEKASEPVLNDPHDLAMGPDGMLYVADKFNNRIAVMDPDTLELLWSFDAVLPGVHDIDFGPDGRAYVSTTGTSSVDVFEIDGQSAERVVSYGGVSRTEGVLAHSNGRIYAMASSTGRLLLIEDNTVKDMYQATPGAHDVAEAPDGTIWIADNFARRLIQIDADLKLLKILDDPAFGFVGPRYLDVDDFGNLVVADQDAHRILLIDPKAERLLGTLGDGTPGIGPGKFDDPEGALVLGSEYYFADSDNNRIVKYTVVTN